MRTDLPITLLAIVPGHELMSCFLDCMRALLDNGIELNFQGYMLDILGLNGVQYWDCGQRSPSSLLYDTVLLYSPKPNGRKCESNIKLMFKATASFTFFTREPASDRILTARFQDGMRYTKEYHTKVVTSYSQRNKVWSVQCGNADENVALD